jgi:hypothetical protein
MQRRLLVTIAIVFTQTFVFADQNSFYPRGELEKRIQWCRTDLILFMTLHITDSFILQDVRLNPDTPRRFQEFSGDISGRFLEVISLDHEEIIIRHGQNELLRRL